MCCFIFNFLGGRGVLVIFFNKKVKRTAFMKKKRVTIFNAIQKLGVKKNKN